jgi:hypothetical protein
MAMGPAIFLDLLSRTSTLTCTNQAFNWAHSLAIYDCTNLGRQSVDDAGDLVPLALLGAELMTK